eukprot:187312-Chlamydomonas_euryale.AAC.1
MARAAALRKLHGQPSPLAAPAGRSRRRCSRQRRQPGRAPSLEGRRWSCPMQADVEACCSTMRKCE